MDDKVSSVDPLRICAHVEVRRQLDGVNPRYYNEIWKCSDCGKEFEALLDIGSSTGKIKVMEPQASLRDQFAMAVMSSLLQKSSLLQNPTVLPNDAGKVASIFYLMADAMMKAREIKR